MSRNSSKWVYFRGPGPEQLLIFEVQKLTQKNNSVQHSDVGRVSLTIEKPGRPRATIQEGSATSGLRARKRPPLPYSHAAFAILLVGFGCAQYCQHCRPAMWPVPPRNCVPA